MRVGKEVDDVGGTKDNQYIPILCVAITSNIHFSSQTDFNSLKNRSNLCFDTLEVRVAFAQISSFFNCENLANFHLKNMILSLQRIFHGKTDLNLPDFPGEKNS
jgi:hypothetical protein